MLTLPAQTLKTMHNFDNTDAALPWDDAGAGQRREFLRDNPERRCGVPGDEVLLSAVQNKK
jgi:hypothetical protein